MAEVPYGEARYEERHPEVQQDPHEALHPSVRQYVQVAVWLAIVTAAEVGIYYVGALRSVLVPFLVVFAVIKFALVVLWFMHLKFDSPWFRRLFVTGLSFALVVFTIVLVTFFLRGGASPTVSG